MACESTNLPIKQQWGTSPISDSDICSFQLTWPRIQKASDIESMCNTIRLYTCIPWHMTFHPYLTRSSSVPPALLLQAFFFVLQLHVNSHDGKISWESPTLLQNDGILPILGRQLSQQHLEAWQCSVLGWYFLSNIVPNWWDITYHWINWCFFQNGSNLRTMDITFSIFSDNITVKELGATAQRVIFHRNISGHVWNEEVG